MFPLVGFKGFYHDMEVMERICVLTFPQSIPVAMVAQRLSTLEARIGLNKPSPPVASRFTKNLVGGKPLRKRLSQLKIPFNNS